MSEEEFRRRLALVIAPVFVEAFRNEEFDVTTARPRDLWRAVDAVCAAEPRPTEAPNVDVHSYMTTCGCADCKYSRERRDEDEITIAELKARAEAAEKRIQTERNEAFFEGIRQAKLSSPTFTADARACAEYVARHVAPCSLNNSRDAVLAAKRYLSGEPAPKVERCNWPDCTNTPKGFTCCLAGVWLPSCSDHAGQNYVTPKPKPPSEAMERLRETVNAWDAATGKPLAVGVNAAERMAKAARAVLNEAGVGK